VRQRNAPQLGSAHSPHISGMLFVISPGAEVGHQLYRPVGLDTEYSGGKAIIPILRAVEGNSWTTIGTRSGCGRCVDVMIVVKPRGTA
jgi:hypothetical protein